MAKKTKKTKKNATKKNKSDKKSTEFKIRPEISWSVKIFFMIFITLSLFSHDYLDPSFNRISRGEIKNYFGIAGSYFSDIIFQLFGVVSYLIPLFFPVYLIKKQFFKDKEIFFVFFLQTLIVLTSVSGIITLYPLADYQGGITGSLIAYYFALIFNKIGTLLILIFAVSVTLIAQYEIPVKKLTVSLVFGAYDLIKSFFLLIWNHLNELKTSDYESAEEGNGVKNKKVAKKKEKIVEDYDLIRMEKLKIKEEIRLEKERLRLEKLRKKKEREEAKKNKVKKGAKEEKSEEDIIIDNLFSEDDGQNDKNEINEGYLKGEVNSDEEKIPEKAFVMYSKTDKVKEENIIEDEQEKIIITPPPVKNDSDINFSDTVSEKTDFKTENHDSFNDSNKDNLNKGEDITEQKDISDEKIEIKIAKKVSPSNLDDFEEQVEKEENNYKLPPLEYLRFEESESNLDQNYLMENAKLIVECLSDFGINDVKVKEIFQGPTLTTYELEIKRGIQISKVIKYTDEIAAMLKVPGVRMISIPQKGVIGVEVPNKKREIVWLKEIIASSEYQKEAKKSKLTVVLGKDISGEPVIANLAKMPHLLIAGTTGSGKSVFNNVLITSILYNATPDEVKFILIDPKMLEFSLYNNIPNLLFPVIIDPQKAAHALNWAVDEMERRYKLIADNSERDIVSYNNKMKRYKEEGMPQDALDKIEEYENLISDIESDESISDMEKEREVRELKLNIAKIKNKYNNPEILPYIVIVLDEYADLMMVAGKNVETSIARIAQKARAAGIHLVIATQRPDKDVVTGIIKANLPVRVALSVKGSTNSKIILDSTGAEKLLGHGDLLYLGPGTSNLRRIQSPLITSDEQKKILDFLREQGKPTYSLDLLNQYDEGDDDMSCEVSDEDKDVKYEEAVKIALEMKKISASYLQRRLKLGYNRAARIVEVMEKEGIVGPPNGSKPRKVIISEYDYKK